MIIRISRQTVSELILLLEYRIFLLCPIVSFPGILMLWLSLVFQYYP